MLPKQAPSLSALKNKILFVIGAIIVYRIGAHVPVPGIDPVRLQDFFNAQGSTILDLFNMFSGGAFTRFTVFALGIMPYISTSIIMQMMGTVSPALAELRKQGEHGREKINQYTRIGTVLLAAFQSIGFAKFLQGADVALFSGLPFYFVVCVTLVTGTMFLMWLGEQITERGIGNGISLIIFASIVSGFPGALSRVMGQAREGQMHILTLVALLLAVVAITAFVVFVERGQRRITVNYAKRQHGRKVYQGQTSHLPLKVNMAGVIPPIFASAILLFPATISEFFSASQTGILADITMMLSPGQPLYILLFSLAIIFFAFFYTALVYNPQETADTLKKSGAFIPGMRPGEQTAKYIDGVMTRLTLTGALYITFVCLVPQFMIIGWNAPFVFGGTSLLIIVVVIMDLMQQIQTHMMSYQYEALMKKVQPKITS
jgi:preprotein translocase subunit SecY